MISNYVASETENERPKNCITIGRLAPDFTASSTQGVITLSQYRGKWVLFFSQPGDFTPVSTTELISFTQLHQEFINRNVQLLAITIDSTFSDIDWLVDIYEKTGLIIPFPLMSDRNAAVANLYGMVNPDRVFEESVRDAFIIDPEGKIRAIITYPVSCGRNTYELLRVIDSIQLTQEHNFYTPADWMPGQPVIVPPPHTLEEALKRNSQAEISGRNCMDWYLCYEDYNTAINTT
ncbi:MAG: peroxiredoxin [Sedimentibacter sp.]|uniref:peroxiredoxin n=1 Tax=Sedimentibacter sp. TaxID=1960295 RepID=UPI003158BA74